MGTNTGGVSRERKSMAKEVKTLEELIGEGGTLGLDSSEDPIDFEGTPNQEEHYGMNSDE